MKQHIHYIALVKLTNDETHKIYQPGAVVRVGDFSQDVLDDWADNGVVMRVTDREGKNDSREE